MQPRRKRRAKRLTGAVRTKIAEAAGKAATPTWPPTLPMAADFLDAFYEKKAR